MQYTFNPALFVVNIIGGLIIILSGCSQGTTRESVDGFKVPEGFSVEHVADATLISYPMFASFDNNGRLFVYESSGQTTSTEDVLEHPTFQIRMLEDENGDGIFDKSIVFADKIPYPMGGVFYQGSLYVAAPPDLIRFKDVDNDGIADEREVILTGWTLNHNAATLSGPYIGPDGWFYLADARRGFNIVTKEGDTLSGKGARIWRCLPDGSKLESMAGGGFDNSIEIAFMPSGETIGTMTYFTDPQGGFRDALMHWVEGGTYPKYSQVIDEDDLTLTGDLMPVMTKMPRIAPAGLMRYKGDFLGDTMRDNLFSAQFNTGRIMRHVITPDGATYTTKDAPFMESDSADTHPTDVLQDADGSLLVINTGGWFIAGCPLSVVAKTNVMGGIYRIKRNSVQKIQDPWGRKIDFEKSTNDEIVSYLADRRFPVRDKAIEEIIKRNDKIVKELSAAIPKIKDNEYRAAAVFAAYRIGSSSALQIVSKALNDTSTIVRVAAIRALGLAKEKSAIAKLEALLEDDMAPVKRQSAIALEQIGDSSAAMALIRASAKADDRFVEHAIIHALIKLKNISQLTKALSNSSPVIRRSCLIALDQIKEGYLQEAQLTPFLFGEDSLLKATAVWVALHHKNWGDMVARFLKDELSRKEIPEHEFSGLSKLATGFSSNTALQNFLAAELLQKNTLEKELFLIDIVEKSPVKAFPDPWQQSLKHLLLANNNAEVRSRILSLLQLRNVKGFDKVLNDIVHNATMELPFRLKALGVMINQKEKLPDDYFTILVQGIDSLNVSTVRQQAVHLLGKADLTDAQLSFLSKNIIPLADNFLLPELVTTYKGNTNEKTGLEMVSTLKKVQAKLDNIAIGDLEKIIAAYPVSVQTEAASLIAFLNEQQKSRLEQLSTLEASLTKGDVEEGRKLFFGKATCFSCHAVGKQGGNFGPDLTNIGDIRARHDILEAIVYPGVSFAREYETSKIVTRSNTYTGVVVEQTSDAVTISTGPGTKVRIQKPDIISVEQENISMMPSGLNKILTPEELSNLIAYLESLPDGLGSIRKH